jgi:hypothetical protein
MLKGGVSLYVPQAICDLQVRTATCTHPASTYSRAKDKEHLEMLE